MDFFEALVKLDELKKLKAPSGADFVKAKKIYAGDDELTRYFYDKNERGELSLGWIELLDKDEEFKVLGKKDAGINERFKASYLVECAENKSEKVLDIIKKIKAKDGVIQSILLDAILRMPEKVAAQSLQVMLYYLSTREYKVWYSLGEPVGKLMVKLIDKHPQEALEIAKVLLDIWWPGEEAKSILDNIRARFTTDEYKRLMFDFYSKVWEKRPFEATSLLVEIYDTYIEEYKKEKGYDTSEYMGICVKDLQNIERLEYHLEAILVKGICDAGKTIVKKQPGKINEILDDLEKRQKGIFYRIVMYLLRLVEAGVETERINRMVGNKKIIENSWCRYEHRRLLNEKFNEVGEDERKAFIEWVKKEKVSEENRKEISEWCKKNDEPMPDFKKMEYREKAEELYFVRERFKELYEEYKAKAGVKNDADLAPQRIVSEMRRVSPMEGTPLEPEVMAKKKIDEVLDFILEPKNYEGKRKPKDWRDPADSLRATFKEDVKKRTIEYLKEGRAKLANLPKEFLSGFFYGIFEAVRDGSFGKKGWSDLIGLVHEVVQKKNMEKEYRNCFSAILSTLRNGFTERDNAIEFDNETIETMWEILETLVKYDEDYETSNYEHDPMQMRCTSVNGEALEQVVMLGIVCKKDFLEYFEEHLKSRIRKIMDYVVRDVKRAEVNCTLGVDLGRIGWIDEEWLRDNIEKIFEGEMWDVVWGTHVSWGRPSRLGFELLKERGIYENAISKLNIPNKYKFAKKPDEGFVEHLMIGYFNEWIDIEDKLLKKFFEKATQKLRGKAARFLTTGFKSVNEEGGEEKEKVSKRMKVYWEKRLEEIGKKPEENIDEVVEFTGWVEDSLLDPKETLELLEQTLDLSGGKFGQMRDVREFIGRICELGKGNELVALRCLKKATADENMRVSWARYEERLIEFLEQISELPKDYENVKEILSEAVNVANLYGRLQPDKFREIWEKLNSVTSKKDKMKRDKVFVSYSHKDKKWFEKVRTHLKVLENEGISINLWADTKIKSGMKWYDEIEKALSTAKIAILLVSTDFLASDFIRKDEIPKLLKASESDGATILPLILKPCRFSKNKKLSEFQAINDPVNPLSRLTENEQDEILLQLTDRIDELMSAEDT